VQFSFDNFVKAFEERFGRLAGTLLLALMGVAVVVFCLWTIGTLGIKPASELISGLTKEGASALPQNFGPLALAAVVMGIVPFVGIILAGRVLTGMVEQRLASVGQVSTALEFRFRSEPPYWLASNSAYRVGVVNTGPASATGVRVTLVNIAPSNPLREETLPSPLMWRDGDLREDIEQGQEAFVDVLRFQISTIGGRGDILSVNFSTYGYIDSFEPADGISYRLHLRVTALNAPARLAEYAVMKVGMGVHFEPVAV
jgi:hypothetical protein